MMKSESTLTPALSHPMGEGDDVYAFGEDRALLLANVAAAGLATQPRSGVAREAM